ncbi:MAG: sigma-70 family RNA polymerase sigma factor [Phycisphaerales bacterium]|jgi:RNA polymerase sigma-70 factor (ECF subfamily)
MIDKPGQNNIQDGANSDSMHEFVRLYSSNARSLYGYILCFVPNWSDAEDLLQDTATIMWTKFSEFTPGTNFIRWACRIARLVIANHYRKKKVRHRKLYLNMELLETIAQAAESSNLLYRDDRIDALQYCLAKLRKRDRKLIRSRYESGSSIKNIAKALGRGIDAVYKSLSRIHYQLLCCIENRLRMENYR